jgi:hypothetical protein
MQIKDIQKIVEKYDNAPGAGSLMAWEVMADDTTCIIHAKLAAAVEIEEAGVRIKAAPAGSVS